MWRWLVGEWNWPAATLFTAVILLVLLPPIASVGGLAFALIYVQLPVYMIHQWEEHAEDRFRSYINRVIGGGREVLTPGAAFWTNAGGVWAVVILATYLAWWIGPSAALFAGYLPLVNGLTHIGAGIARRESNPGLITSVTLFLPLGAWCVWEAGKQAGPIDHAIGLGAVLIGHALIVAHVVLTLRKQKGAPANAR